MIDRRTFLQQATVLGTLLALPFPTFLRKRPQESLGVCLVGLGYYSTDLLAPALQMTAHCHLAGIVTGTPSKIPVWQRRYDIPDHSVYNYETMHEIANNDAINVIYIVLPTALHSRYSIVAAEAGKHVWCEKPMARTADECQAMIDACRRNGVKLAIGYRMQHEPNTQTIISYARSRPFGAINRITAEAGYRDGRSNHWKQQKRMGGGALYDMGVYSINGARYSAGEEPHEILEAAHTTTRPEIYHEVDETTSFTMSFPSGATAQCRTSLGQGMNHLHVDCADGWYELRPFQSYSGIRGRASDGRQFDQSIPNQQAKQMDDDALSIINNADMLVPGEEGLRDIRIVEAVFECARSGRAVRL